MSVNSGHLACPTYVHPDSGTGTVAYLCRAPHWIDHYLWFSLSSSSQAGEDFSIGSGHQCVGRVIVNIGILAHILLKHWEETDSGVGHSQVKLLQFDHCALPKPLRIVWCLTPNQMINAATWADIGWSRQLNVTPGLLHFVPETRPPLLTECECVWSGKTSVLSSRKPHCPDLVHRATRTQAMFFIVQVTQHLTPVQTGYKLKEQCFPMQPTDAVFWQWSRTLLQFRLGFWSLDSWQLCSHCWQYNRAEQVYFCCCTNFIGISKTGTRDIPVNMYVHQRRGSNKVM